jgi:hypothetical protein
MSYAQNGKRDHQLKQFPTQPIPPFLTFLSPSLKEQEQGRNREKMEIRDEGGRWSEDMQSKIIVIEPSNL